MSIRPSDAYEASQTFSLRTVVSPAPAAAAAAAAAPKAVAAAPTAVAPSRAPTTHVLRPRLQWSLSGLPAKTEAPVAAKPPAAEPAILAAIRQSTLRPRPLVDRPSSAVASAVASPPPAVPEPTPSESGGAATLMSAASSVAAAVNSAAAIVKSAAQSTAPAPAPALVPPMQALSAEPAPIRAPARPDAPLAHRHAQQRSVAEMAALLDESNFKTRQMATKLEDTELKLARISHALQTERHSMSVKIHNLQASLRAAGDAETKLRADLASRPKKVAIDDARFQDSVGAALEQAEKLEKQRDELVEVQKQLDVATAARAEIDARLVELNAAHDKLTADVRKLKRARANYQKLAISARDEHAAARTNLEEMRAEIEAAMDKRDEIEAAIEATADAAAGDPAVGNPPPTATPPAATSPKRVRLLEEEVANLERELSEAKAAAVATTAARAPSPAIDPPARAYGRITADFEPETIWHAAIAVPTGKTAGIAALDGAFGPTRASPVAAHVVDAVGAWTRSASPQKEVVDPTQRMIEAVVNDLKAKLTEMSAAEQNILVAPLA